MIRNAKANKNCPIPAMMIAVSKARKARGSAGKTAQQKGQREQEGKGRGA